MTGSELISIYKKVEGSLSRLEVQKLCYFIQEAGEPLGLTYTKNQYGPFTNILSHMLKDLDGHYLKGIEDYDTSLSPITLMPTALEEVDSFLKNYVDSNQRISRIAILIEAF